MHIILKICDAYLLPSVTKIANDACARALKLYFARAKDPTWILKNGEWYDQRVEETIVKGGGPELQSFGQRVVSASTAPSPAAGAPAPISKITGFSSTGTVSIKKLNEQPTTKK
jgi:hypothetical protein